MYVTGRIQKVGLSIPLPSHSCLTASNRTTYLISSVAMSSAKNAKLAFPGHRGEFLAGEMVDYANAVEAGTLPDIVASIQRRFFKRFPPTLADNEEPSAEWLAQVNDNTAEPEIVVPNEDSMTPDEFTAAMTEHKELINRIEKKKEVTDTHLFQSLKFTHQSSTSANSTPACLHVQKEYHSHREGHLERTVEFIHGKVRWRLEEAASKNPFQRMGRAEQGRG